MGRAQLAAPICLNYIMVLPLLFESFKKSLESVCKVMNGLLCLQVVIGCFAYFFLYVYLTAKVAKRLQLKSYTGEAKHFYPAPVCMGLCGEQQHEARLARFHGCICSCTSLLSNVTYGRDHTHHTTSWLVFSADYKISNLVVRLQVG